MSQIPRVVLLMQADRAYERGLLKGILKYSRLHGPWRYFRSIPTVSGGQTPSMAELKKWSADGIIWREQKNTKKILSLNLPTIIAPYSRPYKDRVNILTNDEAIGKMAAEHLLDRGFKNLAYYGLSNQFYYSRNRGNSFAKTAAKAGFKTRIFSGFPRKKILSPMEKQNILIDWLQSLPRPAGIMACNDDLTIGLIEACKVANIRVPEDLTLVGVGNDVMVCDTYAPTISSVVLNLERSGYTAARTLAGLMSGKIKETDNIHIEPLYIATRQSSDILATKDRYIAMALKFIRSNITSKINVKDVVEAVPMSRRSLYNRFRETLGRSIHEEIVQSKMDHAAMLLRETDMKVQEIATCLGYPDAKNLARLFRKHKGMTLLQYRRAT